MQPVIGLYWDQLSTCPRTMPSELGFQQHLDFYWVGSFYGELIKFYLIFIQILLLIKRKGLSLKRRKRSTLLVLAITLHNIPEGLAVGIAFGALANGGTEASLAGALTLALGIGIQNFPEGVAVSMPLRGEGMSRRKSFFYGQFSGMVEPIAAVIGAFAVSFIEPLLPYALSFAAGAMIFVVAEEVIPSSQEKGNKDLAAMSLMVGFALMMILDVALG